MVLALAGRDSELCARKRGAEFCDQLLGGITVFLEATTKVPVAPGTMASPMRELMQQSRIVGLGCGCCFGCDESIGIGHPDMILTRNVACTRVSAADIGASVTHVSIGMSDGLGEGWLDDRGDLVAVDLGGVEHMAVFENGDARFVARVAVGFNRGIVINHDGAAFALAHARADALPLFEASPEVGRVAVRSSRAPQLQHVDSAVLSLGCGVGWHARTGPSPGHNPVTADAPASIAKIMPLVTSLCRSRFNVESLMGHNPWCGGPGQPWAGCLCISGRRARLVGEQCGCGWPA